MIRRLFSREPILPGPWRRHPRTRPIPPADDPVATSLEVRAVTRNARPKEKP